MVLMYYSNENSSLIPVKINKLRNVAQSVTILALVIPCNYPENCKFYGSSIYILISSATFVRQLFCSNNYLASYLWFQYENSNIHWSPDLMEQNIS
jgi:hypothetical protein